MRQLLAVALAACAVSGAVAQPPALDESDRIRLAEAFHLADAVTGEVWPGWEEVPFAVLLVTADHEFLVRHPRPSDDFTSLGYDELLASDVLVRDRVFPPNLLASFPAVEGVPTVVIGQPHATGKSSTYWVLTALHEHFHQLQMGRPDYAANVASLDLAGGDETGMWMLEYPFPYDDPGVRRSILAYRDALVAALGEPARMSDYRKERARLAEALDAAAYRYLSLQLWQEGVARYVEMRVAEAAARRHEPVRGFAALTDFVPYDEAAEALRRLLDGELAALDPASQRRVAFYPLGAAEALLLDAAAPGWQARYFTEPFYLDRYAAGHEGTTRSGISYELMGEGETVVLVHGFSLDRRMWDPQLEALTPHYRVVRYDLRGHGRSAPIEGPFAGHEDLLELFDELRIEEAAIVGLSAGARIAADFALAHPERVSRLVLAGPTLSGYQGDETYEWMAPVLAALRAGDVELAAVRWAETDFMSVPDSAAAASVREQVVGNANLWGIPVNPELMLDPPAAGRLAELQVPVLVVVGERDLRSVHDVAGLINSGAPDARSAVVPEVHHLVSVAAPQAFNRLLLEFLSRDRRARPDDVASAEAIVEALYDVISGPAGEARDWDRFRGLFAPGGRLIPTGQRADGERVMRVQTPQDYIDISGPLLEERGFFEIEIARVEERFGNIAHVWSTYEARWKKDDPEPFVRGINSIQLFDDGERWWVVTVMWDAERPGTIIPERYLPVVRDP